MKLVLVPTVIFTLCSMANAGDSAFGSESKVPKALQETIIAEIQKNCPKVDINSLEELSTTLRVDKIDQGVVDYYYSSTFSAKFYFDGTHLISTILEVESQSLSGYSPSGTEEVRSISNHDGACY